MQSHTSNGEDCETGFVSLKMIFLNILQNVAISLFRYFLLHNAVISENDTFLYN